jgi:GNAT superfamily N-acetyltransferase
MIPQSHYSLCICLQRAHLPRSSKTHHTLLACLTPLLPDLCPSVYANSLHPASLSTILLIYGDGNAAAYKQQQQDQQEHGTTAALLDPSSAVSRGHSQSPCSPHSGANVCFFSLDDATLTAMLQRYVDFSLEFDFAGIERRHVATLCPQLRSWWMQQHSDVGVTLDHDACQQYAYLSSSPPRLVAASSSSSSSLSLSPLPATAEVASTIASHWRYAGPGTAAFILRLLSVLQSWGAWRDGRLVGWAVRQAYGAIGMVHVLEEERGRGVAKQLVAYAVNMMLDERRKASEAGAAAAGGAGDSEATSELCDDWTPFCFINDWNEISQRLFVAVGFKPVLQIDWLTWKPTTAQPAQ